MEKRTYLNKVIRDNEFDLVLSNYSDEELVNLDDDPEDLMILSMDAYGPTFLVWYMNRNYEFRKLTDAILFMKKNGYEA